MKSAKPDRARQNHRTYTSTDIFKIGIKRERLKDWIERGLVQPSIKKATGQGTTHLFSIYDLYAIKLFEKLIERGYSRVNAELRIRWFLKCIQGGEERFWRETTFLLFNNIFKEQDPILKKISDPRQRDKFSRDVERLPMKEHARVLGSFLPVPISEDNNGKQPNEFRCDEKWLCLARVMANDCDDFVVINVRKMREEIDSLFE